jgi:hypothetical protein
MLVGTIFTMAGCATTTKKTSSSSTAATSEKQKQTAKVVLQVDGKEVSSDKVTFKEGATLYQVLDANFKMEAKDGFITSLNGNAQDEAANKYWTFTVNGEQVTKGAKDIKLKANDQVVFNLAAM